MQNKIRPPLAHEAAAQNINLFHHAPPRAAQVPAASTDIGFAPLNRGFYPPRLRGFPAAENQGGLPAPRFQYCVTRHSVQIPRDAVLAPAGFGQALSGGGEVGAEVDSVGGVSDEHIALPE